LLYSLGVSSTTGAEVRSASGASTSEDTSTKSAEAQRVQRVMNCDSSAARISV